MKHPQMRERGKRELHQVVVISDLSVAVMLLQCLEREVKEDSEQIRAQCLCELHTGAQAVLDSLLCALHKKQVYGVRGRARGSVAETHP